MYTVKYGHDKDRHRYTHAHLRTLEEAIASAITWKDSGGWGGWPEGELKVWVEEKGQVVYGEKPSN